MPLNLPDAHGPPNTTLAGEGGASQLPVERSAPHSAQLTLTRQGVRASTASTERKTEVSSSFSLTDFTPTNRESEHHCASAVRTEEKWKNQLAV